MRRRGGWDARSAPSSILASDSLDEEKSSDSSEEAHSRDHAEAISPECGFDGTHGEVTPNVDVVEGTTADRMSPIRRAVNAGSVRSMGETLDASEGAPSTVAVYDLDDISLPSMGEILGNVDQPFEPPGVDVPLFSDASLILALEGGPAGSPPSVDVVPRNTTLFSGEAESPHPDGGVVAGVAEPGAGVAEPDIGGSDGHSFVGQHVPSNAASAPRSRVRRTLLSTLRRLHFEHSLYTFRESLVDGLSQIVGPEDIDFLMDICGCLEDTTKRVDVEPIETVRGIETRVDSLQQEMNKLISISTEGDRQLSSGAEILPQLAEKRDAMVASFKA
ncbi:hypothetical protein ACLOJK_028443 [Asimina triloba]